MIERLEKISAELFKNALKTYHLKDLLTHKRATSNSLTQTLSLYPNKGVGFHIYKKSWTPGLHYRINRAQFKSYKHGHHYGVKVAKVPKSEQLKVMDQHPKRLQGLNKRGIWTYSLGDFDTFKTDNGLEYTRADYEAFIKLRNFKLERTRVETAQTAASPGQEQAEQGQQSNESEAQTK